uniref:Strictosidine synthase conserved region domain-containing protein n=1 Tax=Picea sitchensis TaxID=3332 RepID=D5AEE1_PICSI|nr:unknown [Picea sitchensis]
MDLLINRLTVSILVAGCLVAWFLQLIAHSPISPTPLILQPSYKREGHLAKNNALQAVEKLGEGFLDRPEDTAVDSRGLIYTATQDGWVKRMHLNGSWENWKMVGLASIGLTVSKSGDVLVCTPGLGLLKVSDDQISLLASEINGIPIRVADAVVEASDGSVYFSDASTKFEIDKWVLDLLEAKPYGRLLKYDPITRKTTVLLDGLWFANGVALSPREDYIVICESWKFRCLKHWIKGEKLGSTEILIENLPGAPDNIHIAADGRSYWIALVGIRSRTLEFVYRYGILKHVFATYPNLLEWIGFEKSRAMVVKVGEEGEPIISLEDPNGKVMSFVTSANEVGNYLYLGSLNANFLGRLSAPKVGD